MPADPSRDRGGGHAGGGLSLLRYEDLADALLDAAEDVGLAIEDVEHRLETTKGDRQFRLLCSLDHELKLPPPAEVRFYWDAVLTAASVYGPGCDLYHGDDESCPHQLNQPRGFIDIELKYPVGLPKAEEVPALADRIAQRLSAAMGPDRKLEVKFELSVQTDKKVVVQNAYAFSVWPLEFGDEDVNCNEILAEVRRVLEHLRMMDLPGL